MLYYKVILFICSPRTRWNEPVGKKKKKCPSRWHLRDTNVSPRLIVFVNSPGVTSLWTCVEPWGYELRSYQSVSPAALIAGIKTTAEGNLPALTQSPAGRVPVSPGLWGGCPAPCCGTAHLQVSCSLWTETEGERERVKGHHWKVIVSMSTRTRWIFFSIFFKCLKV